MQQGWNNFTPRFCERPGAHEGHGRRMSPIERPMIFEDDVIMSGFDESICLGRRHAINMATAFTTLTNGTRRVQRLRLLHDGERADARGARPRVAPCVQSAGWRLKDGMPVVWWCRHAGYRDAGRVYGPDLLLGMSDGHRALGTAIFSTVATLASRKACRIPLQSVSGLLRCGMLFAAFPTPYRRGGRGSNRGDQSRGADFVWVGSARRSRKNGWRITSERSALRLSSCGRRLRLPIRRKTASTLLDAEIRIEWAFRLATEPRRLGAALHRR